MSTLANREDPDEMQRKCCISSGSTLFVKIFFKQKNKIFFVNFSLISLDINNRLFQFIVLNQMEESISIQRVKVPIIHLGDFWLKNS